MRPSVRSRLAPPCFQSLATARCCELRSNSQFVHPGCPNPDFYIYATKLCSINTHGARHSEKIFFLTDNNPSNTCTLGYGTDRNYVYTVHTHPDGGAIDGSIGDWSGTPATENFNPALTCATFIGNGALDSNGQLNNHVASACSSQPLTCNQTSTQTIGITGITVRTNTLQWSSTGVSLTNPQPTQ